MSWSGNATDQFQEGKALFKVGPAFFRPSSRPARDLGILAAAVYRQKIGHLTVLDVMTGCGVRSQRYALESGADWIWANDANPDMATVLTDNLSQLPPQRYQLSYHSAAQLFPKCPEQFDFIDLDSFGLPTPFLQGCLQTVKAGGLLYITGTDSRTLAGHNPKHSQRLLGAWARTHPAAHEQGLRLLLGSCWQQAQILGQDIQPIFSYFQGQIYRVLIQVTASQSQHGLGFIGYCHHCGHYQTVAWDQLSRATCPHQGPPLTLSGPMWLGPLHHPTWLTSMQTLAQEWGWSDRVQLLQVMQDEALMPPYFYSVADIGRWGKMDIPKRDRIIAQLHKQGYQASLTHINPQAFKTDAPFHDCLTIAADM
ncbi:class I SAM-dependent methyltransferase [Acaryochloris marina]|uniref:N2,N2-dimethylguanosine tRNA methyltransferase n=1 Tax=Acaryochloris marina (strain MBIC 11017) TaxID=329726 RepID=B0C738_ACAM1|nr:tRNA (guanine-N1)-methyltransferase [Acaryochloris marina]ABW28877.1 N2,N2-dimethylguanosine tRNA methyltransferase [Acaryochloris marina MBIC11017]BDM77856.1 tRNA (guanine(10)-N(2))-dimethyltransferase [Acaryochloris marina MBIC10699]